MATVEDIIKMKNLQMAPFENKYKWFFLNIENDLLSSRPGKVKYLLNEYDYQAKLYVVHQFIEVNENLGNELFTLLELDVENTFMEKKYIDEMVSYF